MRRILCVLACLVAVSASAQTYESRYNQSTPFYFSMTEEIPAGAGTFTLTNQFDHAWRAGAIHFRLPRAWTNTFTVVLEHDIVTNNTIVLVPTTNEFGTVVTNQFRSFEETVLGTVTNALIGPRVVTNALSHTYVKEDDFADWQYVLSRDRLSITLSYTNTAVRFTLTGLR